MDFSLMALRSSLLVSIGTLLIFIAHSTYGGQLHRKHKLNIDRQLDEYKAMLKTENKTVFPDRDIRSLLNPGLRATKPIRLTATQIQRLRPIPTAKRGIISSETSTGSSGKNGNPFPTKSINVRRHRRKWKKNRRQRKMDTPSTPKDDNSNELEAETLDNNFPLGKTTSGSKRSSSRGKERRRKNKSKSKNKNKNRRKRLRKRKMKSSKSSVVVTHISNLPPLKERCKTRPMKQEIKIKGCFSKTITNNFCYGQCNSYYIPETQGRGDGPPAFVSCGFCRPRTVRPIYVQLRCTGRNGQPRWRRKRVSYTKKCRCMAQQVNLDFL